MGRQLEIVLSRMLSNGSIRLDNGVAVGGETFAGCIEAEKK